jgi:hypothetical protein
MGEGGAYFVCFRCLSVLRNDLSNYIVNFGIDTFLSFSVSRDLAATLWNITDTFVTPGYNNCFAGGLVTRSIPAPAAAETAAAILRIAFSG